MAQQSKFAVVQVQFNTLTLETLNKIMSWHPTRGAASLKVQALRDAETDNYSYLCKTYEVVAG